MGTVILMKKQIQVRSVMFIFVIIVICITLITAFLWVSNHSIISIDVRNFTDSDQKNITITGPTNLTTDTKKDVYEKIVKKGTYQVSVIQKNTSSFNLQEQKGYLSKKTIETTPKKDNSNEFIGSNIKDCLDYIDQTLYSWQCNQDTLKLYNHNPASSLYPSVPIPVNIDVGNIDELKIISVVNINNKPYVFTQPDYVESYNESTSQEDLEDSAEYELINMENPDQFIAIKGMSTKKDYLAKSYDNGILIYSKDGTELIQYDNQGKKIKEYKDIDKGDLSFYSINKNNEKLLLTYNQNVSPETPGKLLVTNNDVVDEKYYEKEAGSSSTNALNGSKLIIINTTNNQRTVLDTNYSIKQSRFCEDFLCILTEDELKVYKQNKDKMEYIYSVYGVESIDSFQDNKDVLLVNKNGVVVFNPNNRSGYYSYLFDSYQYCGVQAVTAGRFIVCTQNKNSRQAVLVDTKKENTNNIDKALLSLSNDDDIDAITAYKNNIYIKPKFGDMEYDSNLGIYDYNPIKTKEVSERIRKKILEQGIDINTYNLVGLQN